MALDTARSVYAVVAILVELSFWLAVGAVGEPVSAGDALKTTEPAVPVSSLITPASCAEVVAANWDRGLPVTPQVAQAIVPVVVIGPPVIGLVVAILVTVPLPPPPPAVQTLFSQPQNF